MINKPVFYIFALILLVGTASAYSWHTTITNYLEDVTCGNCTIQGNLYLSSNPAIFYGYENHSSIVMTDSNINIGYSSKNSINQYIFDAIEMSGAYDDAYMRLIASNDNTGQFSEIVLTPSSIDIHDPNKNNGYACWSGGYLISQATPCV